MPRNSMEAFHEFFYSTKDSRPMHGKANYWYHGRTFLSYDTVIAQKEASDDGTNVVFVSIDNFTATTAQHVSSVRQAVPNDWAVLDYPFRKYNSDALSLDQIQRGYEKELLGFTDGQMKTLDRRDRYITLRDSWRKFLELFGREPGEDALRQTRFLDPAAGKCEAVRRRAMETRRAHGRRTPEEKDAAHAKRMGLLLRKADRYRIEDTPPGRLASMLDRLPVTDGFRAKVRTWLMKNGCRYVVPYYGTERWFMKNDRPMSFLEFLENAPYGMRDRPDLALAWVEGGTVVTSMGVRVSVNHVRAAFERFDSLEDKNDFVDYSLANRYRVSNVMPEGLVIGCHVIPIENINELRKEITEDGKEE